MACQGCRPSDLLHPFIVPMIIMVLVQLSASTRAYPARHGVLSGNGECVESAHAPTMQIRLPSKFLVVDRAAEQELLNAHVDTTTFVHVARGAALAVYEGATGEVDMQGSKIQQGGQAVSHRFTWTIEDPATKLSEFGGINSPPFLSSGVLWHLAVRSGEDPSADGSSTIPWLALELHATLSEGWQSGESVRAYGSFDLPHAPADAWWRKMLREGFDAALNSLDTGISFNGLSCHRLAEATHKKRLVIQLELFHVRTDWREDSDHLEARYARAAEQHGTTVAMADALGVRHTLRGLQATIVPDTSGSGELSVRYSKGTFVADNGIKLLSVLLLDNLMCHYGGDGRRAMQKLPQVFALLQAKQAGKPALFDSDGTDVSYLLTPCSRFAWRGPTGLASSESAEEAASAEEHCSGGFCDRGTAAGSGDFGDGSSSRGSFVGLRAGPADWAGSYDRDLTDGDCMDDDGDCTDSDDTFGEDCVNCTNDVEGRDCDCAGDGAAPEDRGVYSLDPAHEGPGIVLLLRDLILLIMVACVLVSVAAIAVPVVARRCRRERLGGEVGATAPVAAPPSQARAASAVSSRGVDAAAVPRQPSADSAQCHRDMPKARNARLRGTVGHGRPRGGASQSARMPRGGSVSPAAPTAPALSRGSAHPRPERCTQIITSLSGLANAVSDSAWKKLRWVWQMACRTVMSARPVAGAVAAALISTPTRVRSFFAQPLWGSRTEGTSGDCGAGSALTASIAAVAANDIEPLQSRSSSFSRTHSVASRSGPASPAAPSSPARAPSEGNGQTAGSTGLPPRMNLPASFGQVAAAAARPQEHGRGQLQQHQQRPAGRATSRARRNLPFSSSATTQNMQSPNLQQRQLGPRQQQNDGQTVSRTPGGHDDTVEPLVSDPNLDLQPGPDQTGDYRNPITARCAVVKTKAQCTAPAAEAEAHAFDYSDAACDSNMCLVCLDGPRQHGFLHGGSMHIGVCTECVARLRPLSELLCPVCREPVERTVAVFS